MVHSTVPASPLYLPAGHNVQGPSSGPDEPAAHGVRQSVGSTLPGGEVLPAGHDLHEAEPIKSLYVPASQAPQAPPLRPVYPLLQTQSASLLLPSNAVEPEGHSLHEASSGAPNSSENFPTEHFKHADSATLP